MFKQILADLSKRQYFLRWLLPKYQQSLYLERIIKLYRAIHCIFLVQISFIFQFLLLPQMMKQLFQVKQKYTMQKFAKIFSKYSLNLLQFSPTLQLQFFLQIILRLSKEKITKTKKQLKINQIKQRNEFQQNQYFNQLRMQLRQSQRDVMNKNIFNLHKLKNLVNQQRSYLQTKTQKKLNNEKYLFKSLMTSANETQINKPSIIKQQIQKHKKSKTEHSIDTYDKFTNTKIQSHLKKSKQQLYHQNCLKNKEHKIASNRYSSCQIPKKKQTNQKKQRYSSQRQILKRQDTQKNMQKMRSKSQQNNSVRGKLKLKKIKQFGDNLYKQLERKYNERYKAKFKNQKLNILAHEHLKIIKNIPEHMIDQNKFQHDISRLLELFREIGSTQFEINRHESQECRTFLAKLIFFIGYEVYMQFQEDFDGDYKKYQLIISNYYQIYFAMRLKIPLIVLQCYEQLIDIAIKANNYIHAQKYSQKCLLAAIYYKQKYYEERCIQKISMCQYYKGNICEATYLHDNNGQITYQSLKKVRDSYNQQQQLDLISHHLYNVPRFQVNQILNNYLRKIESYKILVVFKSPRIEPEQSMQQKKNQAKCDIRIMERIKDFKNEASIMKKQIKRHEGLFNVRRVSSEDKNCLQLVKRSPVVSLQNQSSQILRVHQSLNRIKKIDTIQLKNKWSKQFVQFIRKIKAKLR